MDNSIFWQPSWNWNLMSQIYSVHLLLGVHPCVKFHGCGSNDFCSITVTKIWKDRVTDDNCWAVAYFEGILQVLTKICTSSKHIIKIRFESFFLISIEILNFGSRCHHQFKKFNRATVRDIIFWYEVFIMIKSWIKQLPAL